MSPNESPYLVPNPAEYFFQNLLKGLDPGGPLADPPPVWTTFIVFLRLPLGPLCMRKEHPPLGPFRRSLCDPLPQTCSNDAFHVCKLSCHSFQILNIQQTNKGSCLSPSYRQTKSQSQLAVEENNLNQGNFYERLNKYT